MSAAVGRQWIIAFAFGLVATAAPRSSAAQAPPDAGWSTEIHAGFGLGHVFRFEDQTYGDRSNVAAGIALRYRTGLGVSIELNRTLGLPAAPAPCGILIDGVPANCVGSARNGALSATVASISAEYQFAFGRVRPYVTAGLGVLRTRSVWSTAVVRGNEVFFSEEEMRDTGIGPDLGAGVRFELTPRFSLGPEVRWLDASLQSRANLAVTRVSVRAAYSW
jgi:opacity protein-like surface antigen